ncbi:Rim8p Ecym_6202 [Eremothecium cymbalariae DBVPG|uniref:pH-response regulator protein palF/RIM8 n=1 Tax=Eremothecium cymbalariae (strain CBS 270.75 / DBVPG 7215 / KCTC 17166 / NRRL Y-17582) TaxID=931890 RepID=G8JVA6_ERECY|nr:hypothetical protein Ecym_6202 [Eremothecium cymbalariae DBVPG\
MGFFSKFKLLSSFQAENSPERRLKTLVVVADFYVDIEEPHKIWKPGEFIAGEVVLSLKKPLKNVSVNLALVGKLKVRNGAGATSRLKLERELFKKSTVIYGDIVEKPTAVDDLNGLTRGDHRFPFRMMIPMKNVYTSIEFEKGSISYSVECTLKPLIDSSCSMSKCSKRFSLLVPVDVGPLPKPTTKIVVLQSPQMMRGPRLSMAEQDTSSSLTKKTNPLTISNASATTNTSSKTVTISVDIAESGFTIGDTIKIKVHIQHYKDYSHSAGLIATLVRICRMHGVGKEDPMETFRKDICQCVSPLYIDPNTYDCFVVMNLNVPLDAFPTLVVPDRGFSFQYYIEVLANLSPRNIVYTESNRIVGGSSTTDIPIPSTKGHITKKFSIIPPKLPIPNKNEAGALDESLIFFQDMINVDKLKRLRNVTGTSIEIVIGTHKSDCPQTNTLSKPAGELKEGSSSVPYEDPPTSYISSVSKPEDTYDKLCQQYFGDLISEPSSSRKKQVDNLEADVYPTDPVPRYTANSEYPVTEDKNELEQLRLHELESDPPPENP